MRIPSHSEVAPDQLLIAGAQELAIRLSPDQIAAFRFYRDEILRWSKRMNLTALTTPVDIVREGFLDSLACTTLIPGWARNAIDVGSGAGFPAIPLAIVRDELHLALVEASRKKTTFLKHIARSLNLSRVHVWCGRAEALVGGPLATEFFDVALARAVAPLPEQGALVSPFLCRNGIFLAQVGSGGAPMWALKRLEDIGYEVAGEFQVPSWSGEAGRRIFAFRWVGRLGKAQCFT